MVIENEADEEVVYEAKKEPPADGLIALLLNLLSRRCTDVLSKGRRGNPKKHGIDCTNGEDRWTVTVHLKSDPSQKDEQKGVHGTNGHLCFYWDNNLNKYKLKKGGC